MTDDASVNLALVSLASLRHRLSSVISIMISVLKFAPKIHLSKNVAPLLDDLDPSLQVI